jgi:hypothetical protein
MAASATKVLNIARSQLGYAEGANNDNKFGRWYGMNHVSWCDQFVSWVGDEAGASDIIGKAAYTPSHAAWFKQHGRWGHTPRRGAIAFFDFPDSVRRIQHVGIVERVLPGGRVVTIEGNTSAGHGSQSDGGGVHRRVRTRSLIVGYGYPDYGTESSVRPVPESVRGGRPQPLIVDGGWGKLTTRALQRHLDVPDDGEIGPQTRKALQRELHVPADGAWGPVTRKALQKELGVTQDGEWGPQTVKALQRKLNSDWR